MCQLVVLFFRNQRADSSTNFTFVGLYVETDCLPRIQKESKCKCVSLNKTHFYAYKSNTRFPRILNRDGSAFPTYISNTSYILPFSLHIQPEKFPRIYTALLSRSVALYIHIHTHKYIYIYIRYAQPFYLLRKTSLEAKKISFRACHLYLRYLRDNTCRPMQKTAGTNHVHRKNSWSSFSMRITWYTDVSEYKGREFNICRNSVWNTTYVKYQNSIGS